jgi:hypothetical protein
VLPPGEGSVSLYRLVTSGPGSSVEHLGGALYLFAGAATVGLIALAGIRRPRPWTPYALSAGTAAWALTWVGVLVNQVGFGPHDVGYWMLLASVAVSAAGTIAVWVSARTRDREPTPAAP